MKANFSKNSYLDYISIAVILGIILYFYYQFFKYSADVPVNDDYKAILDFLNKFKATDSFSEQMALLFSQHNEHRIVYDRIWTLIIFKINGTVNFNWLSFIGNLSYFFIFVLLAIPFRKKGFVYLVPIAVLIFNFAFYENMTFPMATLSNNTGLLFILLSIYFAVNQNKYQYLSIVFYVLAVFTVGSGLFLTLLLPAIFMYNKQKKMALIFAGIALLVLAFYFIGYQKPPQTPSIVDTLVGFKFKVVLFFFSFVGSILSFNLIFTNDITDSMMVSAMLGVLIVILYGYLIKKKYYKEHLFVFATITFVLLAAGLTSISRAQFGLDTAIASRYRLYSAIILIGCYYYFVVYTDLKTNIKYGLVVLFSGFYLVNVSLKQREYLDYRQSLNYIGAINYFSGNHKLLNGFEQDVYKTVLEDSKNYQTYTLPEKEASDYFPFSAQVPGLNYTNNTDKWFTQGVEQVYDLKDSFLIIGKGFLDGESSFTQKIYLELENDLTQKTLVFETTRVKRYDMNPYFKKDNLDYGGFSCRIKKDLLDSNQDYTIKLAILNNKLFKKEITDKKIKKTQ